ncbi:MAG: hypothetical protein ACQEQF_10055 [Bacillota bacterium]
MENKLKKLRKKWILFLLILILSAYIIPYLFLTNIERVSGAFLYWIMFALVAIFSTIKITSYWRD